MNQRIKLAALTLFFASASLFIMAPASVFAGCPANPTPKEAAACGVEAAGGDTSNPEAKVNNAIAAAINIFSLAVGLAAVIMIIVGGLRYILSNGDANKVSGAKNAILYAIVGIVIVALAQVIVRYVFARAT